MAGRAMFLLRIKPGEEAEFERRWREALDDLQSHKGFRSRELIRVIDGVGSYVVLSEWDSPEDYFAWRNSLDRARIYSDELSPHFAAPPITGVGEVLVRME
ncbi:MAG: antibiotic biosynthesis monooxygenase family protein [Chloroflexota bacterium]